MILIEPDASFPRAALPKRELSRFLADACERIGLVGEVTVLLSTDGHVQALNQTYRRINKPTDVLSFPAGPPAFEGAEVTGGDLAISIDTARRQAEAIGHSLKLEVQILMLHGLLHLAGLDHEQDTGQMGRRESKLRRHYGLPAGLIQRAGLAETAAVRGWFLKPRALAEAGSERGVRGRTAAGPAAKAGRKAAGRTAGRETAPAKRSALLARVGTGKAAAGKSGPGKADAGKLAAGAAPTTAKASARAGSRATAKSAPKTAHETAPKAVRETAAGTVARTRTRAR